MNKRKISAIIAAAVIVNFSAPTLDVLADEITRNVTSIVENKTTKATISKFDLLNNNNIDAYNEAFKMDNSNIESITNNGGKYANSTIDKSIDGDFNTHWETGNPNKSEFTNEVVFKLKEETSLNRIIYAARQSSAKGKGFAQEVEIYGSVTDEDDDFTLVSSGKYTGSTGDIVEIKFNETKFKRIKFVFKKANQDWASASEFMFYKEDKVSDKMETLFTDDTMSKVSEEFNSEEKINALEEEVKKHPLYEDYKVSLEDAKILLKENKIEATTAKVSRLEAYHNGKDAEYSEFYRMSNSNIIDVSANGGVYPTTKLEYMLDDKPETHWETKTNNSGDFTNEVVFTLDKPEVLNRIAFLARENRKGFPEEFEIYGSETTNGDTFQLVATGSAESTNDFLEFKFEPTKFKRIKFKFVKANIDRPFVAEFRFYKEDEIAEKVERLFTDSTMSVVSEEFNSEEKINALEEEVKNHPFYEDFKENLENARELLKEQKVEATVATTKQFEHYSNEEYSNLFKMDNSNIKSITNNGRHYGSAVITNAIDENLDTYWETNRANTSDFTNEVEVEFKEAVELNRIVYGARKSDRKGFAKEFEIYVSTTSKGDTYQLLATGSHDKVSGLVEAKFNTTKFKRVKFKFKNSDQNWASLSEIAFYKKDDINDKIDKLFTDDTMSVVSEEFNTIDKLNALEEEAKKHPLYESFKENLENAKALVNDKKVEATAATTKQFEHYSNEEYSNLYKMNNDNIKSITNNGRHYGSAVITNAIDGDLDTYWETNTANTSDFTNEVEVEFKEAVELNRIIYGARQSDSKGFAKEFEIYSSTTSKGDTYQLVATGGYNKVSGLVEAKFNTTKFKRVKFKFKNSDQNWASLSEIAFYKEDIVSDKVDKLFTNGLMNELSEEFNTIEKLQALENEAKGHPLEELFRADIKLAKDILNNGINANNTIELERRGNSIQEANKRKVWGFQDWQVTGLTARPGDVIDVYVDVKDGEATPKLIYKQTLNRHGSSTTFNLNKGKNTIVIPEYDNEKDDVLPGTIFGGALYFTNYESDKQSAAPRVRIEGAKKYPMYVGGKSSDEQVMKELEEYVNKINEDPENTVDIFDISTNQTLVTVKATYALEWYKNNNKMPSYTANTWEKVMDDTYEFWGFDNSTELNSRFNSRMIFMIKNITGGTFMNAGSGTVGVREGNQDALLSADRGWGVMHEIGHNMDTSGRTMVELTNNILPIYMPTVNGNVSRITTDNVWERKIYPKVSKEDYSDNVWQDASGEDSLAQLSPLWQLHLYDNTFYPKFEQAYRANDFKLQNREQITESWVKVSSDILKLDLYEFFERHGIHASEEIKNEVSKYPKPDSKLWYLNDNKINYEGNGFTKDTNLNLSLSRVNEGVKLTFNVAEDVKSDLLGYEILKDGKVIGFTAANTFVDTSADITNNSKYEVIPYDINLGTRDSAVINSFTPSISIKQDKITLELREEFNPMDYVKVLNYEGNDITSKVEVTHNVDTSKKGKYEVKYRITDEGISVEKIVEVEVVSSYDYASDLQEVFSKVGSGRLTKDKSIKGGTITFLRNGNEFVHSKGIGAHANSEVVYNIENKGYDYFESYIGVDQSVKNTAASVTFEVWVDGEKKFDSKVFEHDTDSGYVRVNVSGAKEVKLITTDANIRGDLYDHSIWADAKFITNNSKPIINTEDKVYKLGENVDFKSGITAIDTEDGDLTSKIEIISNSYEKDKLGRFEVVYKVTDSDNNSVEKKAYVTIYEDFTVNKSKFGQFDNLDKYNEEFKIPVSSVSNNAGRYGNSVIENAIDGNVNTHWETNKPNSDNFQNEVIFDLGESKEINRIAYKPRNGGKGFAKKFEIYTSNEAEGNDFILAGKGEYTGNVNDLVEFKIAKTTARRVMFKFIEAHENWAAIGEMTFYKEDTLADKINTLFTDNTKTCVSESYNTLEKVAALRDEVKNHPAANLFEEDLAKAEEIIRAKFPKIAITKSLSTKVGEVIDLNDGYSATDSEDGDITSKVEVTGKVNFNKTGKYPITYKVTDSDGNEVIETRNVAVVDMNDYNYLTDYDWTSTQNSYASPIKDKSASAKVLRLTDENGSEVSFERGIGAHATSTITYDLRDKDYAYFTSYVGVDRQMFGTVGSVSFEVYVDGEKKFDSGLMTSKEPMKYVEVDINGAKELKLVVTDGGNGIGSDHGTWGDTKLHFANDVQSNYEELESIVEEANGYEKNEYTEETFKVLEDALNKANVILADRISTQEEINSIVSEIKDAISNLEEAVDLNEVIVIGDKYLKKAIKKELNLSGDDITIGDMYKLKNVSFMGSGIESIEGLQYAKNLEAIDLSYNEIKDLSPLKNLKKLTSINVHLQMISAGMLEVKDNKVTLDYKVLNKNGDRLMPKAISIKSNRSDEAVNLSLEEIIDENGVISFDTSNFDKYVHSMYIVYEDSESNYLSQSLFMFDVK